MSALQHCPEAQTSPAEHAPPPQQVALDGAQAEPQHCWLVEQQTPPQRVGQLAPVLFRHQLTVAWAAAWQLLEEAQAKVFPSEDSYQPWQVPPPLGQEAQARICLPPPQLTHWLQV